MATDNNDLERLRNPQVDYERSDLSARGILLFLVGLLVCGIFIELVLWGMFRFMGKSEALFPQPKPNPMASYRKAAPETGTRSILQNAPAENVMVFPEPRLQTNDVADMSKMLESEDKVLYPSEPFKDSTGAIHIPITSAMQLIAQQGLPVRPEAPSPNGSAQMKSGNAEPGAAKPVPAPPR